ncbi:Inulin fructotransferase [DFA-I-forming] [Raoultella terrigena]|uniref:Inulin fructotransferase [DFA-I-forming] n=1 Tax=Raoultella terrigena TaxID=577 RepID=A0A7Z8ZF01_RAOTE|nr:Inulin fructotransferase [DFA-I-forming] [Raoultella terrigena]
MASENYYDVTEWNIGNPYQDIGEVINSIITNIKARQTDVDINDGGKPGAVIYIPPGDYHLMTQVVVDISYLKIMGSGHGFTSSSIRFNTPESDVANWHEVWPGGSRILVDLSPTAGMRNIGARHFMFNGMETHVSARLNSLIFVSTVCILSMMAQDTTIQRIPTPMEKQVFISQVLRTHSG